MTLSITDTQHKNVVHYVECHYAECHVLFIVMLSVSVLNVVILSVIMLNTMASLGYAGSHGHKRTSLLHAFNEALKVS